MIGLFICVVVKHLSYERCSRERERGVRKRGRCGELRESESEGDVEVLKVSTM